MKPRERLPDITDAPRTEFLRGWWNGILCGVAIGMGAAVIAGVLR